VNKKKVLIIQRRPGIGDMCLFFPCIDEICKAFKDYEIFLLTNKRSKSNEILKDYDGIKKIYFYEKFRGFLGFFKLINFMKSKQFDDIIIFHYGLKYFLASKLCNIDKIFNYGFKKKNENIVNESRKLVKIILNRNDLVFSPYFDFYKKKKIFEQNILFGIAGSGDDKKWGIENFIELAKKIYAIKKIKIIVAGGKEEKKDYDYIKKKLSNFDIDSICDLTIQDSLEFISNSSLYIGNDTGFMHLAGALRVKSFGLFGNTPTNYASYNNNITPIIPENFERITHGSEAMDKITVNYVFDRIKEFI